MHRYYLSLCRGLIGYYVLFEAPDEATVRRHAAEYFGRMWCSVYDEDYFVDHILHNYSHHSDQRLQTHSAGKLGVGVIK